MKKCAFLIHARETADISRRFPLAQFVPDKWVDGAIRRLTGRMGFTVCSQFDVFDEARAYLIGVILTGRQMMTLPLDIVRKRIMDCALFAQDKLGVDVIGLGALIPPRTGAGQWIAENPEVKVGITHGDHYTVAVAVEGIENLMDSNGYDPKKDKIAVVGAYGLIGEAISKIIGRKGYRLILVGTNIKKLENLTEKIEGSADISISTDLMSIQEAALIVTATSHPGSLIRPEHLREGATIYDIAQPVNASPELVKVRPDVTRVDGGYVSINGIKLRFKMGPPRGATFACIAETMMQTLARDIEHHVGSIDLSHVNKTEKWAQRYGFSHAPFSCFSKPIGKRHCKDPNGRT